ncbi:unnamed protein product [Closterium sp. Naga37s-1]|nr:unnamed protein product [Closterium sp. Naga37s-1]
MERKYRVIKERVREREPGDASAENGEGANAHLVLKPKWFKWIDRYLSKSLGCFFPHSFSATSSSFRPPAPPGVAPPGGVSAALLSPQGAGPPGNLGTGGGSGGGGGAGGGNGGGGAAGAAVPQGGFWGQLVSPAGDGSMGQDGFPTPGNIPGGMPFPGSAFGGQASTNGGSLAGVTTGGGGGGISSSALEQKLDEVIRVVRESNEEWQKRFVEEQEKNRQLFRELFMTFMGPRMSAPAT